MLMLAMIIGRKTEMARLTVMMMMRMVLVMMMLHVGKEDAVHI